MTADEPGRLRRLWDWSRYNYPQLLTLAGTLSVGIGGIGGLADKETWGWFTWVIILGVILTAVGGVAGLAVTPSITRLIDSERDSRRRADTLVDGIRSAFAGELAQMLMFVDRYVPGARASLYLHAEDKFHIVSRSSSDPNLRPFGRKSYPLTQGVIGHAWSNGQAVAVDLPSRRDHWNTHMARNYGIPVAEAGELRMQSRSLVALRVDHDGPAGARPLGVAVLESVEPNAMGSDQRDSIIGSSEWRMFSAAVIGGLDALQAASFSDDAAAAKATLANVGALSAQPADDRPLATQAKKVAARAVRQPRRVALIVTNWVTIAGIVLFALGVAISVADPTKNPSGAGIVVAGISILVIGACALMYVILGVIAIAARIRRAWADKR